MKLQLRPAQSSSCPHGPAPARTDSSSGPHIPAPVRTFEVPRECRLKNDILASLKVIGIIAFKLQDNMGRKLRHLLIFLLIILKELNMPEAGCSCKSSSHCKCSNLDLTSIPQNLPPTLYGLDLKPTVLSGHDHQYEDVDNKITTNTATSDDDHQYEDIDKKHNQKGQGQSQATTKFNTNTTAAIVTASGHDHQYEDVDQHNKTDQGQSQATTKFNTNTTATVVTIGRDHQYEDMNQLNQTRLGQSQATTKFNTSNPVAVVNSGNNNQNEDIDKQHNQTGQGQSQAIITLLDSGNPSYGTGLTVSQLNALYKVEGPDQDITNTSAAVGTIGHDQTEQGQY
uniref:Uncharacterized protein n=1 Tax=Branchiostoma floridae TaxID=7739 RepID=C3YV19_BRAFL|eukprot:XP_002599870.1 hypothetical protein BRAFLDRAFT_95559 [Branchiostoma floridae]